MAEVRFTPHLSRFFPDLAPARLAGETVGEVLGGLEALHPGLSAYLVDESGALRKHVNVLVDARPVHDRAGLSDPVREATVLHVMQALSGG